MGVPKFFRFMSERYPCLNELVKEFQLPDFDNLYLDMNGIIHACSHPVDFDPQFIITEENIFASIFHYIEVLFSIIKPKKLFFMAVDGVAPRAKMNQQRARRFRSAKETESRTKQALKEGVGVEGLKSFDSNCITPGTVFMDRLHSQLKYFVTSKISTDPHWQNCKVILSGHQTPGEGEHKIMDYIRYLKTLPDYDENTTHCLYGLDADLVILGMSTHEPHFTLLREKVLFSKSRNKRIKSPDEMEFYLLHLSLLREYLDLEFQELKESLPFEYNLENIIDDWILMGLLVGNDFIPNLPDLHINKGALPILYAAYKDVLPSLDGYLNENGYLNLQRFQKFMERLSKHDLDTFQDTYANLIFLEEKMGQTSVSHKKANGENERKSDLNALIKSTEEELEMSDDEEVISDENDDAENNDTFLWEFSQHKRNYYTSKLDYSNVTEEVLKSQAEGYIRAIQWNLHYYYQGCQSWSWYYPYHYSPYISDITNFKDVNLEFEMGKPFLPFEQLLAVLPAASKKLLPAAFQDLMTSPDSPVKDFYPNDFDIDLNGKDQEWEAVVLIPFIDEKRLLEAMESCKDKLTPEERKRNQHGPMHVYTYTEEDLGHYNSVKYFPRIVSNHAAVKDVYREEIEVEKSQLKYGLHPKVSLDVFFCGFPTLKYIPFEAELKPFKVKVFDSPSRGNNMVLILTKRQFPPLQDVAESILGKIIYVNWPYLTEARVVAVSDGSTRLSISEGETFKSEEEQNSTKLEWKNDCLTIENMYQSKLGIQIGKVKIIVYTQTPEGQKYMSGPMGKVTLEKFWNVESKPHALQTIVKGIPVQHQDSRPHTDIIEAFPLNSIAFMLGQPYFGSMGRILDNSECWKTGRLKIAFETVNDPHIDESLLMSQSKTSYLPCRLAALKVGIHPRLLFRISGIVLISMTKEEGPESKGSKVNIGLNLKFYKKNEEIPGYTKKVNDYWLYSMKAVDIISQYVERFSRVVEYLSDNWDYNIFVQDIFPGSEGLAEMKAMVEWIKDQEYNKVEKIKCGTEMVESDVIAKIEEIVENSQTQKFTTTMNIKPHLLYKSDLVFGNIPPITSARHHLLDRVVSVKSSYTVPVGLRGFIIGIHPPTDNAERLYDVLFDKSFVGASRGMSSGEKIFRMSGTFLINITDCQRKSQIKMPKKINAGAANSFTSLNFKPEWKNSQNSAFVQWFQPPAPAQSSEGNEEFQKLWSSLEKPQEEPTNALKKILKIEEARKVPEGKKIEDPVKSFFEKVTKRSNDPPEFSPAAAPSVRENSYHSKSKYSNQLFSYCQKRNLGQPRFKYMKQGSKVIAQVKLSDGRLYTGIPCEDKEAACESVALQALGVLEEVPCDSEILTRKESDKKVTASKSMEFPRGKQSHQQQQQQQNKQRVPSRCQVPPVPPTPPSQWVGLSGYQKKGQSRDSKPFNQNYSISSQHPNRKHQASALEFVPLQAIAGKRRFNYRNTFQSTTHGSQGTQKQPQEMQRKPQHVPGNPSQNWTNPSPAQPKRKPKIAANLGLDPNLS